MGLHHPVHSAPIGPLLSHPQFSPCVLPWKWKQQISSKRIYVPNYTASLLLLLSWICKGPIPLLSGLGNGCMACPDLNVTHFWESGVNETRFGSKGTVQFFALNAAVLEPSSKLYKLHPDNVILIKSWVIFGLTFHSYRPTSEEATGTPLAITVGKIIDTALSQI
jgi:hypothetical protein